MLLREMNKLHYGSSAYGLQILAGESKGEIKDVLLLN
jgi:hypothetical protein